MTLKLDLSGRAALVTGGSRGIGRAIALALGGAGASVAVGGRDEDQLAETAAQVKACDGRPADAGVVTVRGDLSDPAGADAYVRAAAESFGRLDIVVANAGIWEEDGIDKLTPEFVRRLLAVNLEAAMYLCRAAAPWVRRSPAGRIVTISSTASLMGEPHHSTYAASKGGLDAFTRSLAVELGPEGITVNSVAPGWTRTEMAEDALQTDAGRAVVESIPLKKVATPEDVAYAVAYLCSDWAGHISGVTLPVEGAYRIRR